MDFLKNFEILYENFFALDVRMLVMWAIGGILIYLAIKKEMEPTLLLPMGFGAILVNLPFSGAITQMAENGELEVGALDVLFGAGIANELFPLILFIGIGAMIDFGPLLSNPKLMIFGAAAQFGIFFTLCLASMFFPINDAASIAIIGAADGPTSIVVANKLNSEYLGAIMVAAYSYMALVPIIQPPVIKLLTTKKERQIKMKQLRKVSKLEKVVFPILVSFVVGILLPDAMPLLGMLMFGNLIKEIGADTSRLFDAASNSIMNAATVFLGLCVGATMTVDAFLNWSTIGILAGGFLAFCLSISGGIWLVKLFNMFSKQKINPLVGATGLSAVPMASRVANEIALKYDKKNFVLNYCMASNISGVIGSAVAAGILIAFLS